MCEIGEKIIGIENLPIGIYSLLEEKDMNDALWHGQRSLIVFGAIAPNGNVYTNCLLYIPRFAAFRPPAVSKGWNLETFQKIRNNPQ